MAFSATLGYEEGASVVETSIRRNLMLKYKDDLLNRVTAESALWTFVTSDKSR